MFNEPMPLDRKILDVSQGLARTFSKRIYDESARAIIGFDGEETLEVRLGAGFNSEIVEVDGLAAVWTVASEGKYEIQVPAVEIEQGIYPVQVILDPNEQACYPSPREIYRGYLRINPSPVTASGTPYQLYCDYADLLEVAPWIETTHTDNDMSGWFRQRLRARQWIDSAVLRCTSNNAHRHAIFYGVLAPFSGNSSYVADLLQSDKLVVSDEIRRTAAHYTLFLIADALSSAPTTGSYKEVAQKHYSQANSMLQSCVAGFDTSDSGQANYFVDMRLVDGRITY
jgi:hypothetical protein